jgi:hypothetical protein
MAMDILNKYFEDGSKKEVPKILIYSFDDSKDEVTDALVSFRAGMARWIVDRERYSDDYEQRVKNAYEELKLLVRGNFLELADLEDIPTWRKLMTDIYEQHQAHKNIVVFIDGISQVEYEGEDKRLERNESKSTEMKKLTNLLQIPVLITQEPPKDCPVRPTKDHIAETRRWSLDAKLVICLSELDGKVKEEQSRSDSIIYPEVVMSIEKNKWSPFKGFFFTQLDVTHLRFKQMDLKTMLDADRTALLKRKISYELGATKR